MLPKPELAYFAIADIAKFEGDAAFVYAMAEKVDGSLLQDTIKVAYFKFRRRLRDIKQASTCECKAYCPKSRRRDGGCGKAVTRPVIVT